jgi:hypothetical protein
MSELSTIVLDRVNFSIHDYIVLNYPECDPEDYIFIGNGINYAEIYRLEHGLLIALHTHDEVQILTADNIDNVLHYLASFLCRDSFTVYGFIDMEMVSRHWKPANLSLKHLAKEYYNSGGNT